MWFTLANTWCVYTAEQPQPALWRKSVPRKQFPLSK